MEDSRVTFSALILLVAVLGVLIGTIVAAPAVTVILMVLASLSYIAGMVFFTVRG